MISNTERVRKHCQTNKSLQWRNSKAKSMSERSRLNKFLALNILFRHDWNNSQKVGRNPNKILLNRQVCSSLSNSLAEAQLYARLSMQLSNFAADSLWPYPCQNGEGIVALATSLYSIWNIIQCQRHCFLTKCVDSCFIVFYWFINEIIKYVLRNSINKMKHTFL